MTSDRTLGALFYHKIKKEKKWMKGKKEDNPVSNSRMKIERPALSKKYTIKSLSNENRQNI